MKLVDIRAALEPHVRKRMRALEPSAPLGNGTMLADAAATVASHVLAKRGSRMARRPEESAGALSDDEMRQIMQDMLDLLHLTGSQEKRQLPGGMIMEPGWRTGVRVGTIMYVPIRGRPGLHEMGNLQDRFLPERPGARRLREEIAFHMLRLPAMDIPKPSAEDIRIENEYRYRDRLLVPMRGGPGITFLDEETIDPAECMLDTEIDLLARTTAGKALALWKRREQVDEAYAQVEAEIGPLIAAQQEAGNPVRLAGVHVKEEGVGQKWHRVTVRPVLEVLGNDLKTTNWIPFVDKTTSLTKVFNARMSVQRRRKKILDEVTSTGMRGRIDRVTLEAIRAFAPDPAEILRRMGRERKLTIDVGRRGNKVDALRLTWRDGKIMSSFAFTEGVTWSHGSLIVKTTKFPQSVLDALPGKPIRTLVEHPFLQPGDKIRSVRDIDREGGWTYFHVETSWTTFDAETGEVLT